MYKIISDNNVVGVFENVKFIRLRGNGCYILCDENEAEGICIKVPKEVENEIVDEETNLVSIEKRIIYEDVVYRFGDKNLTGTEPLCIIEKVENINKDMITE